jgi:DNA-binding PadR family transcriptional regulator
MKEDFEDNEWMMVATGLPGQMYRIRERQKKELKALLTRAADALESLHKPAQGDFDHLISELRKAAELDLLRPSTSG